MAGKLPKVQRLKSVQRNELEFIWVFPDSSWENLPEELWGMTENLVSSKKWPLIALMYLLRINYPLDCNFLQCKNASSPSCCKEMRAARTPTKVCLLKSRWAIGDEVWGRAEAGSKKDASSLMPAGVLPLKEMVGKFCPQSEYVKRTFLNFSEQWWFLKRLPNVCLPVTWKQEGFFPTLKLENSPICPETQRLVWYRTKAKT